MTIRAKFVFESYTASLTTALIDPSKGWTNENTRPTEIRPLKFRPVYNNGDPTHENTKFFAATPSGTVELGVVMPEAWAQFGLGKEYYLDFSEAPA